MLELKSIPHITHNRDGTSSRFQEVGFKRLSARTQPADCFQLKHVSPCFHFDGPSHSQLKFTLKEIGWWSLLFARYPLMPLKLGSANPGFLSIHL